MEEQNQQPSAYPPIKEERLTLEQFKEKMRSIAEGLEKLKKENTIITVVYDPAVVVPDPPSAEAAEDSKEMEEERLKRLQAAAKARLDSLEL